MNSFLVSLSHSCMYGRGSIGVLEEVIELRTMSLLALVCKKNELRFFVKVDKRRCRWLMHAVIFTIWVDC